MSDKKTNDRQEWVERFKTRIAGQGGLAGKDLDEAVEAELDSWPENGGGAPLGDSWDCWIPEEAADSNMSYWTDD